MPITTHIINHFFLSAYCHTHTHTHTGTLPEELAHFSGSLRELNFAGGSITGTIPATFEKLTNLEILNLNDQCLSGTIPTFLSTLPKLGLLTLADNCFLGQGAYLSSSLAIDKTCCTKLWPTTKKNNSSKRNYSMNSTMCGIL